MDIILDEKIRDIETLLNIETLNEEELVDLLNLLVKHELRPGGPYFTDVLDKKRAIEINKKIYLLFARAGKHLPGAKKFSGVQQPPALVRNSTPNTTKSSFSSIRMVVQSLPGEIYVHTDVNKLILAIENNDANGEISSLSYSFLNSTRAREKDMSNVNLAPLANLLDEANTYTWVSYSIFDKIIDDNKQVDLLGFANIIHRESMAKYASVFKDISEVHNSFKVVDVANTIEMVNKQLPLVEQLKSIKTLRRLMHEKSIPHILGPQYITLMLMPDKYRTISSALSIYCAARQLNDDLHDWIDDLNERKITYVVARILKDANISSLDDINLSQLKKVFLEKTSLTLAEELIHMTNTAITTLESTILVPDSEFCARYLHPLKKTGENIKKETATTYKLLKAYKTNVT